MRIMQKNVKQTFGVELIIDEMNVLNAIFDF